MTNLQEHTFALGLLEAAQNAAFIVSQPQDRQATVAAILMHALVLATPELSQEGRQRLFLKEEE